MLLFTLNAFKNAAKKAYRFSLNVLTVLAISLIILGNIIFCITTCVYLYLGCSFVLKQLTPPSPLRIYVNVADTPTRNSVIMGLLHWQCELSDFQWQLSSQPEGSLVFRDWKPEDEAQQDTLVGKGITNLTWIAYTNGEHNEVVFNRWVDDKPGQTATHEIGHVLGLSHNPDRESVMYWRQQEQYQPILASDLAPLAGKHTISHKKFCTWTPYGGREFSILPKSVTTPRFDETKPLVYFVAGDWTAAFQDLFAK